MTAPSAPARSLCTLVLVCLSVWTSTVAAQSTSGFYLRQDIGLGMAPSVELLGNSTDRASRCDEFINPRYAEIPGCTDPNRAPVQAGEPATTGLPESWQVFPWDTGSVAGFAQRWSGSTASPPTIRLLQSRAPRPPGSRTRRRSAGTWLPRRRASRAHCTTG